MKQRSVKIAGSVIRETEKAIQIRENLLQMESVWIPKSVVKRTAHFTAKTTGETISSVLEIPFWFAAKNPVLSDPTWLYTEELVISMMREDFGVREFEGWVA